MAISITLKEYLADQHVRYDELPHLNTNTSMETAVASHIPSECVAKAVLLSDGTRYLLATLPASRRLDVARLSDYLDQDLTLASEDEVAEVFEDCELGAVPPTGEAYGLPVVWDDTLANQADIYFEGGDHKTLVHVDGIDFVRMMGGAKHTTISQPQ